LISTLVGGESINYEIKIRAASEHDVKLAATPSYSALKIFFFKDNSSLISKLTSR
jgi:hypothetical protein